MKNPRKPTMKPKSGPTIEMLDPQILKARERNPRTHPAAQLEALAKSIREFGFTAPVLIDADNVLIAGHGRVAAAIHAKLDAVPCVRVTHLSDAQVRAYVIADNRLSESAEWDNNLLGEELKALKENGFDIGLTGFDEDQLEEIIRSIEGSGSEYTKKIEAPIYTPKGERPQIKELFDPSRAEALINEIESAKLPHDVEQFLKTAAARHFVFNYEKIAEFYCHADKKTQELMENSALIIIDFNKAMQRGYAQLKSEISEAILEDGEESNTDND